MEEKCDDGFDLDLPSHPLTGHDYVTLPLTDLAPHVDYSNKAMIAVLAVSAMTTKQLEDLHDLLNEKDI